MSDVDDTKAEVCGVLQVAGFNRAAGEGRMNTLVTMGSVLTSWKGRNARGKRTLAGLTRLVMYTALDDSTALVRGFSRWRVVAVCQRSQRKASERTDAVDAAARAKTAALGTKLEAMVRQAAGVERIQAMIRQCDTAAAAKMIGEWKVFMLECDMARKEEAIKKGNTKEAERRKQASASIVGRALFNTLKGTCYDYFRTWKEEVDERRAVRRNAVAIKIATMWRLHVPHNRDMIWVRWRERSIVARGCSQVAALKRIDSLLFHNTVTHAIQALSCWISAQLLAKARRLRDLDVGKVAWRYQSFGHQLVAAQLCANFCDKVRHCLIT